MSGEHAISKCYILAEPFSTIVQLYREGQFYWWRKPPTCHKSLTNFIIMLYTTSVYWRTGREGGPEVPEKITDLPQVIDKLYHNVVHLALIEFALTTSVVTVTDCIGSCKSSYHAITGSLPPPP